MTTTLAIKDGNNNSQTLITNTISGNQMPVRNIGDPSGSGFNANVLASNESQYGLAVTQIPQSIASCTTYINATLAGTVDQIKSSQGNLYGATIYNSNASVAFVQVFFVPSASVTLGSTTPSYIIPISATSTMNVTFELPMGASGTGLSVASTTTATGSSAQTVVFSARYM